MKIFIITRYGYYEFVVPFGFTNALATFMFLMNDVFSKYLDRFSLVFFDGIVIYSKNEEEHVEHLRLTLKFPRKHKLYVGLSKCDFYKDIIHYLGHIISDKGISGDPKNIEAMMSWPALRKLIDIRSFEGLAGYCRKLTKEDSAGKVKPMYRLRMTSWLQKSDFLQEAAM